MINTPFLPFAKPYVSEEAIADVNECLRSGWITTGPKVEQFERMLGDYHSGRKALCVSSATAGLKLSLQAIGLQEGDEVITTPLTFIATLNAIVLAGGKPVLVDVSSDTLNMDMNRLEDAITPRTKVILPVHFAGFPVDLNTLYELADRHGLRTVEDCAHAIGAEYGNRRIGSFGDVQVFSFHPNKNITTGEGGAIVTDDETIARTVEKLRFHGIDRPKLNRYAKFGLWRYDVAMPGCKFNMMDIQAAMGIHQLPMLDGFIKKRTQLASSYLEQLKDFIGLTLPSPAPYPHRHSWNLFTVRIQENAAGLDRNGFMQMMKARQIGTGLHYRSAHVFSWYRENLGWQPEDFPNALDIGNRICSLPLFPTLETSDQQRVVDTTKQVLSDTSVKRRRED